jgi:riboflavin transporter 2
LLYKASTDQTVYFQVLVSVSAAAVVSYCKIAISALMRDQGRKHLLWFGISTQVGSCVGALSIFAPVNVYNMFKQA